MSKEIKYARREKVGDREIIYQEQYDSVKALRKGEGKVKAGNIVAIIPISQLKQDKSESISV